MNATPNPAPPPGQQETDAERDERHISVCRMLTDVAAELAQAAAGAAMREFNKSMLPPDRNAKQPTAAKHPASLFATLAAVARQAMATERQIAEAAVKRRTQHPTYRAPNPRRPTIARALQQAAFGHPKASALREEMEIALERELTETPEAPTPDIIRRICNGFGIPIDPGPHPSYRQHLEAALNTS